MFWGQSMSRAVSAPYSWVSTHALDGTAYQTGRTTASDLEPAGTWTWEAWWRNDDLPTSGGSRYLFQSYQVGPPNVQLYNFALYNNAGTYQYLWATFKNGTKEQQLWDAGDGANFEAGRWQYFGGIWRNSDTQAGAGSGSETRQELYQGNLGTLPTSLGNGTILAQADGNDYVRGDGDFVTKPGEIILGNGNNGDIDEFRLWSDERTPSELQANYRKQISGATAGLWHNWRLNFNYNDEVGAGFALTNVAGGFIANPDSF